MNDRQTRLLLETEFQFYALQESALDFSLRLRRLGYKPQPDLAKLDNFGLKKLNGLLRASLRNG